MDRNLQGLKAGEDCSHHATGCEEDSPTMLQAEMRRTVSTMLQADKEDCSHHATGWWESAPPFA